MSEIDHLDHPAAAAFRMTAREVAALLNEHDQLRQSYECVCEERDEARAQAAELAEQVDALRAEHRVVQTERDAAVALCDHRLEESKRHAAATREAVRQLGEGREVMRIIAGPVKRSGLAASLRSLSAGPPAYPEARAAEAAFGQLAPVEPDGPADRRVPLYPDRVRDL